jgi:hypothetical protein
MRVLLGAAGSYRAGYNFKNKNIKNIKNSQIMQMDSTVTPKTVCTLNNFSKLSL